MELMTTNRKIGLIIYVIIIIFNVMSLTAVYLNAKKKPDFYRLFAANLTILVWLFFGIIETLSRGTDFFFIALRCTLFPITFIGAVWIYFVVYYVRVLPKMYEKWLLLIFVPPVITYIPFMIPSLEPWVISEMLSNVKVVRWGPLFDADIMLSRVYILGSIALLLRKMYQDGDSKISSFLLVGSLILPFMLNLLDYLKLIKYPDFDLTVVSLSLYLVIVVNLVFKHRIIDIFPYASHEIFTRIQDAVIISNAMGKITDYNASTIEHFGGLIDFKNCDDIYKLLDRVVDLTDHPDLVRNRIKNALNNETGQLFEDTLVIYLSPGLIRQYGITIIPVYSSNKVRIGKLVHIKDITRFNQAALSGERKRLSADLHDSMGNCLNVISSNLEYVLNRHEPKDKIKECVQIAYEKTINAYMDLRRIVDNLRPMEIEKNGVVWALESLFKKLRGRKIQIEFFHEYVRVESRNASEIEEAIYFICQEALTNSIIHGSAESISVVLSSKESNVDLYITDDGIGCNEIVENKGLRSIRERVDLLNGTTSFTSYSEGGFTIKISLHTAPDNSMCTEEAK